MKRVAVCDKENLEIGQNGIVNVICKQQARIAFLRKFIKGRRNII